MDGKLTLVEFFKNNIDRKKQRRITGLSLVLMIFSILRPLTAVALYIDGADDIEHLLAAAADVALGVMILVFACRFRKTKSERDAAFAAGFGVVSFILTIALDLNFQIADVLNYVLFDYWFGFEIPTEIFAFITSGFFTVVFAVINYIFARLLNKSYKMYLEMPENGF